MHYNINFDHKKIECRNSLGYRYASKGSIHKISLSAYPI